MTGALEPSDPTGKLAELRKDIQAGLDQMREGKVTEVDPMALLDEVDREAAAAGEPIIVRSLESWLP